ncbi:MAG: hypothetical protein ACLFUS_12190 [Candidatus Sumerlaeia bacterium]
MKKNHVSFISLVSATMAAILLYCASPIFGQTVFNQPEKITSGNEAYQLSRNANGSIAFDASDTLHLTYWSGGFMASPTMPSHIYYQSKTADGDWASPIAIDDSKVQVAGPYQGQHIGGRHPSMAVLPDGTVWIIWQDHRHCNPATPYNSIDNTEVYGDRMLPGGTFTDTDIRLTTSSAEHFGDNAYHPKVASNNAGRIGAAWFDFHFDFDLADIFLKVSADDGAFDPADTMADMRFTSDGSDSGANYNQMPDIAMTDTAAHLVWYKGLAGVGGDLFYAEAPFDGDASGPIMIEADVGNYWYPPHIEVGRDGSVWIAYGAPADSEKITLLRKRPGQSAFDAPVQLTSAPGKQYNADMVVAADGTIHLAWIDTRAEQHIYYGHYDPETGSLLQERRITESASDWTRPAIAVDSLGQPHVVFEERQNYTDGGAIYYCEPMQLDITSQDIVDFLLGRKTFTTEEQNQADVNADGKIDMADVIFMRR